MNKTKKNTVKIMIAVLLILVLIASIGFNIYFFFFDEYYDIFNRSGWKSYLQSTDQIYIMEAGILKSGLEFKEGKDFTIKYDFDNEEYPLLIEKYKIDEIAGNGTEFEKAKNLMSEFAWRLYHKSNYDNSVDMNAIALLEYSLDNREQGINCLNKAQILNEMCLALGIYSRKVWIVPNSVYDGDCHVVNEVWDTTLNKWVMLDITHNQYWVDENGTPLSVIEIRTKGANQEFCTAVWAGDDLSDLQRSKAENIGSFLYIMKNMYRIQYCDTQTVGESEDRYFLSPKNFEPEYEYVLEQAISLENCESSPIE